MSANEFECVRVKINLIPELTRTSAHPRRQEFRKTRVHTTIGNRDCDPFTLTKNTSFLAFFACNLHFLSVKTIKNSVFYV